MSQSNHALTATPTKVRFLVLAWLCGLAALAYVHRNCVSVLVKPIEKDLGIDHDDMGTVMSVFFISYGIFQIPCGWIGARWGSRRALTFFILLWSAATAGMGLVNGVTGLCIAQLVRGFAQAGLFPCCVNTISKWFPETEKAFPNGMLGSFMSVGAVLTLLLTSSLLYWLSWWQILLYLSIPGFVCALWFFYWFRDRPSEHPAVNQEELARIEGDSPRHDSSTFDAGLQVGTPLPAWMMMLLNPRTWIICAQQCFRAAAYVFFLTWYPTFLIEVHKVPVSEAGFLSTLPVIGVIIGSALGGALMDWTYRRTKSRKLSRQGVAVLSTAVCGSLIILAYFTHHPIITTGILALAVVSGGLCSAAGYVINIDLGGRHVTLLFSMMNMMGNFGAAGIAKLIPKIVGTQNWNEALLVVAGLYFLASLSWALLNTEGSIFPERENNAVSAT